MNLLLIRIQEKLLLNATTVRRITDFIPTRKQETESNVNCLPVRDQVSIDIAFQMLNSNTVPRYKIRVVSTVHSGII